MHHGSFFSLGGVLSRFWRTPSSVAPWICASSLLTAGAIWDRVRTGGPIDFVLLGLAGYELVIGLTEEAGPASLATAADRVDNHPAGHQ